MKKLLKFRNTPESKNPKKDLEKQRAKERSEVNHFKGKN